MDLKGLYRRYNRYIRPVLYLKNRLFGIRISQHGSGNQIFGIDQCRAKGVSISVSGSNNQIHIGDMSSLFGVSISIVGSNNKIILGDRSYLSCVSFCIEDDNNTIATGTHTYIYNNTEISAIESTSVMIGENCLISGNVMIRSGDSHILLDRKSGKRINDSKDISIGNHVWLGNDCKILKGSKISDGCVAATGAVITASSPREENCVLAGMPARVVRHDIDWNQYRT